MTGPARTLPARPSLRHLKAEARRRVKSGEFPRSMKLSWPSRASMGSRAGLGWAQENSSAVSPSRKAAPCRRLRWILSRFADADDPGWTARDDQELRPHVDDEFLARVGVGRLVEPIAGIAADPRQEYGVTGMSPLTTQVQVADAASPHGPDSLVIPRSRTRFSETPS